MKKLLVVLTVLLCVCLLAGCGKCKVTITADDTMGSVMVADVNGNLVSECEKDTVLYVYVEPTGVNAVKSVTINGQEVELDKDGMVSVQATGNLKVNVDFFNPYEERANSTVLAERRDIVEANMRENCNTLFMYDKDLPHQRAGRDHSLYGNTLYRGVPYNNGNISFDGYMNYVKEVDETTGIYHMDTSYFIDQYGCLLGNNCADAVYWAWSEISDTISLRYAAETTARKGIIYVGGWEYDRDVYVDTPTILVENGVDKMNECYALLLKGDGIVFQKNGGGHLALIAENHVVRKDDGTIDDTKSYVIYHDTNGAYYDVEVTLANGETATAKSACVVDGKLTYGALFNMGYLPVTIPELMYESEAVDPIEWSDTEAGNLSKATVVKGVIECNYYMDYHTMVITDKAGNVVQEAVRQSHEQNHKDFDLAGFKTLEHDDCGLGYKLYTANDVIKVNDLPAGEYHCKLTSHISNGEEIVVRDFDFTV